MAGRGQGQHPSPRRGTRDVTFQVLLRHGDGKSRVCPLLKRATY